MTRTPRPVGRTGHLEEILRALYPHPYRLRGRGVPVASYRLVHPGRPRLLVPARRHLAAAALRCVAPPASPSARLGIRIGAAFPGVTRLLPCVRVYGPDQGIRFDRFLSTALGAGPVHMVLHIGGPARSNRKPVAALLDDAGNPVGYAKVGIGPLSDALIRAERAALQTVAPCGLRRVRVPALRYAGRWRDHEVAVTAALPVWQPAVPNRTLLAEAAAEIARCRGTHRAPLSTSRYAEALRFAVHRTRDARLQAALEAVLDRHGVTELEYGACHGDWTPWNTHPLADAVLAWDWERFAVGVPVGFDALHYEVAAASPKDELPDPARLLAPMRVPPEEARLVAALYLIDIAARYANDQQRTAASRTVAERLLPRMVKELCP